VPVNFTIDLVSIFFKAQTNFKPGYVITINGQTIRGFINEKEWGANPVLRLDKKCISYPVKAGFF